MEICTLRVLPRFNFYGDTWQINRLQGPKDKDKYVLSLNDPDWLEFEYYIISFWWVKQRLFTECYLRNIFTTEYVPLLQAKDANLTKKYTKLYTGVTHKVKSTSTFN